MKLKWVGFLGIAGFLGLVGLMWFFSQQKAVAERKSLSATVPQKIRSFLSNPKLSDIGVYYYDLDSKEAFGYHDTHSFTPASLMKLGIMLTYFKQAEDMPDTLSEKILYSGHNASVEENDVASPLVAGKSYTVSELIRRMIRYSDNDAMFLLLTPFVDVEMKNTYMQLGLSQTDINNPDFTLTPQDIGKIYTALYTNSYLNQQYSREALTLLESSDFSSGLIAGLPQRVRVAHKYGFRNHKDNTYTLSDSGIVFTKHPYVLCVMTRGRNILLQESEIASISHEIYTVSTSN